MVQQYNQSLTRRLYSILMASCAMLGLYRRALADTVEHFTAGVYRPTQTDIDQLKSEGI